MSQPSQSSQYRPNCAGVIPFTPDLKSVVLVTTHKGVAGFPKGKIERGHKQKDGSGTKKAKDASVFAAGCRELDEETGLSTADIKISEQLCVYEESNGGRPGEIALFPAIMVNPDFSFKPKDVDEIASVRKVPIDEALKLLMPKRQTVLKEALALLTRTPL